VFIGINGRNTREGHSVFSEQLAESRVRISILALLGSLKGSIEEVEVGQILGREFLRINVKIIKESSSLVASNNE
jgi:hypothetical protein